MDGAASCFRTARKRSLNGASAAGERFFFAARWRRRRRRGEVFTGAARRRGRPRNSGARRRGLNFFCFVSCRCCANGRARRHFASSERANERADRHASWWSSTLPPTWISGPRCWWLPCSGVCVCAQGGVTAWFFCWLFGVLVAGMRLYFCDSGMVQFAGETEFVCAFLFDSLLAEPERKPLIGGF